MPTDTVLEVVMPQMGVSVSEGTVTRWLRNVGDAVSADESLLEVSTDKVDTEVPSPGGGVLQEILVAEGETVAVGTVLARIGSEGSGTTTAPPPTSAPATETPTADEPAVQEPVVDQAVVDEPVVDQPVAEEPQSPAALDQQPAAAAAPAASTLAEANGDEQAHAGEDAHTFISPVVARIAATHGIDPTQIEGSGRGGRVTKKDVLAYVGEADATPATPPEAAPPPAAPSQAAPTRAAPSTTAPVAAEADALAPDERLEPMSLMRRGIAEHMRRSLDTAAHVTSAIEVDMSKVVSIRERIKKEMTSSYGVNPTFLAFIARATVDALHDWPWVNAELRGESILTRSHVNLGIAVALDDGKGLIVPVIKNAEGLNLLGMSKAIADLAERARTKKLLPDDVQGGTFTITNPGGYGTLLGTPVINQPQSAILGTYAIVKRPWVIADERGQDAIAIRSIMNLTLTYDHRLVDGAYGAQFLRDLAHRLETWGEADY